MPIEIYLFERVQRRRTRRGLNFVNVVLTLGLLAMAHNGMEVAMDAIKAAQGARPS